MASFITFFLVVALKTGSVWSLTYEHISKNSWTIRNSPQRIVHLQKNKTTNQKTHQLL